MCTVLDKPLTPAYLRGKDLRQLSVLTSLAMTSSVTFCRWYIASPWTCPQAEHQLPLSSLPHICQVSVSVSVSKYRYRYRLSFLVSEPALVKSHITKFKKTQAENALTNNDTKEAWKVIKQALNQNPTATRPPFSLSDLNNYFSQSTSSQNSTDSSSCLSGCSKQNAFTIQDIPSYVVSNYLKQLKIST